jgi:hypothetical protein
MKEGLEEETCIVRDAAVRALEVRATVYVEAAKSKYNVPVQEVASETGQHAIRVAVIWAEHLVIGEHQDMEGDAAEFIERVGQYWGYGMADAQKPVDLRK